MNKTATKSATDFVGAILVEMNKTMGDKDAPKIIESCSKQGASLRSQTGTSETEGIPAGKPNQNKNKDQNKDSHTRQNEAKKSVEQKGEGKSSKPKSTTSDSQSSKELDSLKEQLKNVNKTLGELGKIIPIVQELKAAHDA